MIKSMEGQRVPQVKFKTRCDNKWVDLSSDDVFAGKSVIVFSLPGAFTPTCSSSHVPRFNQLQPLFQARGIDEVICVSVNDAFVMDEWRRSQKADRVTFLPDGNGDFTSRMGLLVGKEDLGFGKRSWRYSMLVRDGIIEKMFIEPDEPGDPFKVSDADTMLSYIDPQAELPHDVTVMSRPGCPFCARAKGLLRDAGIEFDELVLNRDFTDRTLRAVANATSYPQVFVDGQRIGDSDDLEAWLAADRSKAA
ncbi:MAG: glutathione peroxidase [Gammaproteobacteria bacterium]|nr:glutathione peroxidase [Gammaproteobacteria bacterium]MDH3433513.1 glutathione peroxidase [Gammaproteobacteria bacterium]